MEILINRKNFDRSFLGGKGTLKVISREWTDSFESNKSFTPNDDVSFSVEVSIQDNQIFRFGEGSGIELSVGGASDLGHNVTLIWPDQQGNSVVQDLNLELLNSDEYYAVLNLDARGKVNNVAKMPAGPLTLGISSDAGAGLDYYRFKAYQLNQHSAKDVILDLVKNISLPQQVDHPCLIPDEKEVRLIRYDGYLDLGGSLSWGYQFSGLKSISSLNLKFKHYLRLVSSIAFGYRLAGSFEIEARRGAFNIPGEEPKWARFVVRKSKQSNFSFAADFGLSSGFELTGLRDTADDFIGRLIGADAESVLKELEKASEFADLHTLEHKVQNHFTKALAEKLVKEWGGDELSNQQTQTVLGSGLITKR